MITRNLHGGETKNNLLPQVSGGDEPREAMALLSGGIS